MAIARVAIVGLGLIGSSIARAIDERLPQMTVTGHDASDDVRGVARELGLCDTIVDDPVAAVADADLVILAVPGGRTEEHPSELPSLMRISYAVFCLNKKNKQLNNQIKS